MLLRTTDSYYQRILRLQEYDFKLEYELGINNIADILLRKSFFDTHKVNEAEHFVKYQLVMQ